MARINDVLAELAANPGRVEDLPEDNLPDLLAELERLRARIWSELARPRIPSSHNPGEAAETGDRLLDAQDVAELLDVAPRYVYDHADDWPFTRRLSPRKLRFSERGLYRWLETRR